MHTIYRLEASNGKGPWSDSKFNDIVYDTRPYQRHNKIPNIRKDFPQWSRYYYCAFPNKTTLRKWFTPKELERLKERGMKLYKLKVKKFVPGTHQVFFTKRSIIEKHEIS